jgi:uncharacterized membrane protein YuzA (DUF378 family)
MRVENLGAKGAIHQITYNCTGLATIAMSFSTFKVAKEAVKKQLI